MGNEPEEITLKKEELVSETQQIQQGNQQQLQVQLQLQSTASVQNVGTEAEDLSPQEKLDAGNKYDTLNARSDELTVSMETGNLTNENTDFVIHGKNGFEFPVVRIYSSQQAKLDSPSIIELLYKLTLGDSVDSARVLNILGLINNTSYNSYCSVHRKASSLTPENIYTNLLGKYQKDGDFALSCGNGWKWKLPYVSCDSSGTNVCIPDGRIYSLKGMKLIKQASGTYEPKDVYENHLDEDFTFEILKTAIIDSRGAPTGYKISGYRLIMKDGMSYSFNLNGQITEISDPARTNVITISYDNKFLISSIKDPFGNTITLTYQKADKRVKSCIKTVTFNATSSKINYGYDATSSTVLSNSSISDIYTYLNRTELKNPPRLVTVTDRGGRKSQYEYFTYNAEGTADLSTRVYNETKFETQYINDYFTKMNFGDYSSYLVTGISKYKENLFGLEYPELLTKITDFFGYIKKITYKKVTVTVDAADKVSGNPEKKDSVNVSLITSLNGSKTEYKSYSLVKKLYKNNQLLIDTSTVYDTNNSSDANKVTVSNKYKKIEKDGNLYSQLESCKKSLAGVTVSESTYTWDSSNRLLTEETKKGKNTAKISNTYDNWGNVFKQTVTKKDALGRTTEKTVSSDIRHTNSTVLSDSVFTDRPTTPSVEGKYIKNLVTKRKISIDGTVIYKSFQYDSSGRKVREGIYINGHWADTLTEYNGSGSSINSGLSSKTTTPEGQVYTYTYTLDAGIMYKETKALSVKLDDSSDTLTTVSTKIGIDTKNGQKVYDKDGKGIVTTYVHDVLERLTKKDTTKAGGYIQTISYNDSTRTVTISKTDKVTENGTTVEKIRPYTKYYYDSRKNIIQTDRYDYKTNSSAAQIIKELFEYNGRNFLVSYTDENSNKTKYEYDRLGRLTKQTHTNGFYETNTYDDVNNVTTRTNSSSFNSRKEYLNFDEKVIQITRTGNSSLPALTVKTTEYDVDGKIKKETDANGYSTSYTYEVSGGIKSIKKDTLTLEKSGYQDSQTPMVLIDYTDSGLVKAEKDGTAFAAARVSRAVRNTYNGIGLKLREVKSGEVSATYGTDTRTVKYKYDNNGNITKETYPDGNSKTFTYNSMNLLSSVTDENGIKVAFVYDRDGNNTKITEDSKYISQFYYDDFGRLIKSVLPSVTENGQTNVTLYEYDKHGNLIKQTDGEGCITEWKYNSENMRIFMAVKNGTENIMTRGWKYYPYGELEAEYRGCTIDSSNVLSGGSKITFTYDGYGRIAQKTNSSGETEKYTYDKKDNVISIIDAAGNVKKFEYNKLGFLTKETDENGIVTVHYYNVWGQETYRIEDSSGRDIEWKIDYSSFGEVIKETHYPSRTWTYEYNERGLLKKKTDPKGIVSSYIYDKCGRKTSQENVFGSIKSSKVYIYDSLGNLTKSTCGSVTSEMTYSKAYGLVTGSSTTVNGNKTSVSYSYDRNQRCTYVKYPDGKEISFAYNKAGLITGIKNGSTVYASSGTYNKTGSLTQMNGGNGSYRKETWNASKNLLEGYGWNIGNSKDESVVWDTRGNITGITRNGTATEYNYDKKSQLTKEKSGSTESNYEYDGTGNRKKREGGTVVCYANSNLVKQHGSWKYNYDKNGNLTYKGTAATAKSGGALYEGWTFNASSGTLWRYSYDSFNRLVKVEKSSSGTGGLKAVENNQYDYGDQLVYRKNGSVEEYLDYNSEGKLIYDKRGTKVREYVYANGKIWCEIQGSNVYYHHTDHLGTTEYITNSAKSVLWKCKYNAFGKVASKTDASFIPCFTGKMQDIETGLYYFNARWYDSEGGRFITEDPYRDGTNWYVYCGNNPLVNLDETGLFYYNGNEQVSSSQTPEPHVSYGGYNSSPVVLPSGNNSTNNLSITSDNLMTINQKENNSILKMGGYKLDSYELINYLIEIVIARGILGKKYSKDSNGIYVCTTFVSEMLDFIPVSKSDYLPYEQRVIDNILNVGNKFESNGTNPPSGTYIFYFDYGNGSGHTGFVSFDSKGNTKILHNGSDGKGNQCVNIRTRDARDFKTWFDNKDGNLYYKKLEADIWIE